MTDVAVTRWQLRPLSYRSSVRSMAAGYFTPAAPHRPIRRFPADCAQPFRSAARMRVWRFDGFLSESATDPA